MKIKNYPIKYDDGEYIDPIHFFTTIYDEIPFRMIFSDVSCDELFKKWENKHDIVLKTELIHFDKQYIGRSFFKLIDGVVGFISRDYSQDNDVQILYKKGIDTKLIAPFIKDIKSLYKVKSSNKNKIEVLFNDGNYSDFKSFDIKKIKLDVTQNYNDDFVPIHKTIVSELNKKDANGLVILYGDPGTGKTHYLRYLTSILDKKKLFIPSNMASSLANPDFISKLEDNKGSILIIEDADDILSRKGDGNTAVANLLNLSDGLLADILSIQIICTFNSPLTVIDKALLRKGRVIAKYEFKALVKEKAQALSNKLGFNKVINDAAKLSDIYNTDANDFENEHTKIGFK